MNLSGEVVYNSSGDAKLWEAMLKWPPDSNYLLIKDGEWEVSYLEGLLLTTDTTYLPTSFGPAETDRLAGTTRLELTIDRVIAYDYDRLYRLTEADYRLTGLTPEPTVDLYEYEYDPAGNRLAQIINGDTRRGERLGVGAHQTGP